MSNKLISISFPEDVLDIKIYSRNKFIRFLQKIHLVRVFTFREICKIYTEIVSNIYGK